MNNQEFENLPTTSELQAKIKEYADFIDQTLRVELENSVAKREKVEFEIHEYQELKTSIIQIQKQNEENKLQNISKNEIESLVDLGYGTAYCRATVEDTNFIYVNIGLGFHAEFTLSEAITFIDKKVSHLNENVLPEKIRKAKIVASHLEQAITILESLTMETDHGSSQDNGN